jgi:hypothetical protein
VAATPIKYDPEKEACPVPLARLKISERSYFSFQKNEWDNFARASFGSFLGSWRVIKARRLFGVVRFFDFILSDGSSTNHKVGQCALLVDAQSVTFLDRIYLVPAQRDLRDRCLALICEQFGARRYNYGSHWNEEEYSPDPAICGFATGAFTDHPFQIDVIDFRDWPDFHAYRRAVSENIRRDFRKARKASTLLRTRFGPAAARDLVALVAMRACMMRKNKESFSQTFDFFVHAAKLAILGENGFITTAKINGRCYSAFFGAKFGRNIYYISGGTRQNRMGAGSYLLLTLIEAWFSENPTGKVLMGDSASPSDQNAYHDGALLYRHKLRARPINGVEFQFVVKNSTRVGKHTSLTEERRSTNLSPTAMALLRS